MEPLNLSLLIELVRGWSKVTYIKCPARDGDSVNVTKWDGGAGSRGNGEEGPFPQTNVDSCISKSLKTFLKYGLLQMAFLFRKVNRDHEILTKHWCTVESSACQGLAANFPGSSIERG